MIDLLKFDRPEQFPKDEILNDSDRLVRSWASVEVTDKQGDVVPISEMKKVLNTWFKRGATMIDQHSNRPIGRGLRWQEMLHPETGKQGIVIDYQVFNDYSLDDEVWDDIKAGKRTGLSIGGRSTGKAEVKMDDYTNKPGKFLSGLELYEISAVDNPANQFGKNIAINYLAKSDKGLSPEALAKKLLGDLSKGFVVKDAEQPFAGFSSMDDCVGAQLKRGHSEESAKRIATFLMHQTNKDWVAESKSEGKVAVQGSLKDERDDLISKCDAAIKQKSSCKKLEKASWLNKKPLRKGGWKMKNKNDLMKRRVYLKPGQEAPSGVNVQEGKHGGKFYETQGSGSGEGKVPKPGKAPQRDGEMPDFSQWGFDANSKETSEDFDGESVGVGSKVKIHPELTNDPRNKRGEEGIVVGLNEHGDLLVEFMDGEYGAYESDAVMNADGGPARDAGDALDIADKEAITMMAEDNRVSDSELAESFYGDQLRQAAKNPDLQSGVKDKILRAAELSDILEGGAQSEQQSRESARILGDLGSFDEDNLNNLERDIYDKARKNGKSKDEALQRVIDSVEGDYSQLSEELSEIAEQNDARRSEAQRFEDGEREQEGIDEAQSAHAERASRNQKSSKAVQAFEGAGGAFNASELAHRFSAEDLKQALRMAEDNPIVVGSKGIAALRSAIPKAEKSDKSKSFESEKEGNVKKNTWPEDITKELNKPLKKSVWPEEIIKSLTEIQRFK